MKFLSKLGITSLMLASSSLMAAEPAMGWYAGFMLGPSTASSNNITVQNPPVSLGFAPITGDLSYNILGNFGAQLGYRCNKFRYEGELVFNRNNLKDFTVNGITFDSNSEDRINGNTTTGAALFNVFYEFYDEDNAETAFVPYFGLGIGYANVKNTLTFTPRRFPEVEFKNTASGNAAIGQAILGFSYFFNDNVSLGSDLRYMKSQTINDFNSSISVGSWNFLMNFSFDQPGY